MLVLKAVTVVVVLAYLATDNCGDLSPIITEKDTVVIVSSNLPEEDQTDLVSKLQELYDNYPEPADRVIFFSRYFDSKYNETLNNIVVGYKAAAYDQKLYIEFIAENEKFVAYGA